MSFKHPRARITTIKPKSHDGRWGWRIEEAPRTVCADDPTDGWKVVKESGYFSSDSKIAATQAAKAALHKIRTQREHDALPGEETVAVP